MRQPDLYTATRRRLGRLANGWLAIAAIALAAGCATTLQVTTTPPGAQIFVDGQGKGLSPAALQLENRDRPYIIMATKEGYANESQEVRSADNRKELAINLQELRHTQTFSFTSTPGECVVLINGRAIGKTPVEAPVTFERASKSDPWKPVEVRFEKPNYQSERQVLAGWNNPKVDQALELLRDEADIGFSYASQDGQSLSPTVTVDGGAGQQNATKLHFVFSRASKDQPWSSHQVTAEIPGIYQPKSYKVERGAPKLVKMVLEPVTEVEVARNVPTVRVGPTGAVIYIDTTARIGAISVGERGTEIQGLARITRFSRREPGSNAHLQALNSYAVLPDGQNVIMAITSTDDQGRSYSNLFVKRTDDEGGGISRLTESTNYFDAAPVVAPDGSNFLVFQSNRSERKKPDIFRVQLVDNRFSGGIARITNDSRFNFSPTYADSNREIVYLSLEADYAQATPQISSVRFDGSLPTQLQITASEVSHREIEHIYFVRRDENSGKLQLYSVLPDGKLETALITDEGFRNANCFNPIASFASPHRVLFVSDKEKDEKGRSQNDIYVMNADGSGIQRLTSNLSDDICPAWSPNEPDVVYFMSNRGGAYNIWRMRLPATR